MTTDESAENSMRIEKKKKKKRKARREKVEVEMEAFSESPQRIAPFVGYFPSGYNPDSPDADPPSVRVFRNKRRSNRLELVVTPPESNVEFVGTSYSGEAAASAQLCTYALGVLDKDTGVLKILPITANKIFRLEPRVIKSPSADTEPLEGIAEDDLSAGNVGQRLAELTSLYGTKKNRDMDKRWRSINEQRKDSSNREDLDIQGIDAEKNNVLDVAKETVIRNIPPYDSSAVLPEKAYLLDEIILKAEKDHLLDILEIVQSGADWKTTFWQENGYPNFVINRRHKLREIQDEEEQKKLACILSYITHLVKFWKLAKASRRSTPMLHSGAAHTHKIPRITYQKFMSMFLDSVSNMMSTEKMELLIGYILVLTLFADEFHTYPSDIALDLDVSYSVIKSYYLQLGCKNVQDGHLEKAAMTLPVPLQFPEGKIRRRKR